MIKHEHDITGLYCPPGILSTYTGAYIDLINPTPDMFLIEDIAHQLSMMPRFTGRTDKLYSVAQHSIECSRHVAPGYELAALLHDASEAYINDMASPAKAEMKDYKVVENRLMVQIAKRFGFKYPCDSEVKSIDTFMLEYEWSALVRKQVRVHYMTPEEAEDLFIGRYNFLTRNK